MSASPARVRRPAPRSVSQNPADWWQGPGTSVAVSHKIDDVISDWQRLEASGIESPGQSLDFTRAWVKTFAIPESEQLYVTGSMHGEVVALLPLHRQARGNFVRLSWFPGDHVGCHAPLIDRVAFDKMSEADRVEFWRTMQRGFADADLICLDAIPDGGEKCYFKGLGDSHPVDHLYRSQFNSWEECDQIQRTRSRRKHDKQQGAKLEAMGEVSFEEVTSGPDIENILTILFAQKAIRFREWGIADPFADATVRGLYKNLFDCAGPLQARLHVLRLDGEIVSVRYNLGHGDRVFALISSMSDDPELSPGSPGKQNLLRAQKHMFSSGVKMVDMGAGYSDEKRHWCNVTIPVRNHVLGLTRKGKVAAQLIGWQAGLHRRIKHDKRLFGLAKDLRATVGNAFKRGA